MFSSFQFSLGHTCTLLFSDIDGVPGQGQGPDQHPETEKSEAQTDHGETGVLVPENVEITGLVHERGDGRGVGNGKIVAVTEMSVGEIGTGGIKTEIRRSVIARETGRGLAPNLLKKTESKLAFFTRCS